MDTQIITSEERKQQRTLRDSMRSFKKILDLRSIYDRI